MDVRSEKRKVGQGGSGNPVLCQVLAVEQYSICFLSVVIKVSAIAAFPLVLLNMSSHFYLAVLISRLEAMDCCSIPPLPLPSDDLRPPLSYHLHGVIVG